MNLTRLRLVLLTLVSLPLGLPAQTPTPAAATPPPSTDSGQPTTAPKKERAISKDLSSALSAGYKYNPPPPPKPEAENEEVDLRDIDKPRNGIIRLPKYVVEGQRPPVFNNRNLYSKEMLRRLAYQRYSSAFSRNVLNRFHILGRADEAYAMMQYEAEERKQNMAEMDDKVSMYRVSGDDAEAEKLKDDTQRTFMRRTEGLVTPGAAK